jgi:hypothetical protein
MIYLCFGIPKSGSTLAFELTCALLEAAGHTQVRLQGTLFPEDKKVNFLSRQAMRQFDRAEARRIEAIAPAPRVLAVKTHAAPTPAVRELVGEGLIMGQANFRDPRDTLLSLLDAGDRANRRGRGAFVNMRDFQAALGAFESNLAAFEEWVALPGFIATRFDEVAFSGEAFMRRVADQLRLDLPAGLDLGELVRHVHHHAFTQRNKGVPRRHRDELTINQSLFLLQRWGPQLERHAGEDLDTVDRALLEAAASIPEIQLDAEQTKRLNAPPKPKTGRVMRSAATPRLACFFERNLLMHTHLEKAAGSTLIRSLMQIFGTGEVVDLRMAGTERPDKMATADRHRIRILSGHFHFGAWERCFERRAVYLATVRDPFERFRSFHAFVSVRPRHPAYPLIGERTLGEAVEIAVRNGHGCAVDYLARYFGGSTRWRPFAQVRAHLEQRYVAVVPHTEVGRLIACTADAFGVAPPAELKRNVAASYPASDEGRTLFVKRNRLDYQVFDYVNDRCEQWLTEFPSRLTRIAV